MATAINTPNAMCYFQPRLHPYSDERIPGSATPCRVMPKTIKFFNAPGIVHQVKREPGQMTYNGGTIVMNTTHVAARLVATPMTVIHTAYDTNGGGENWDSVVIPTAEVATWFRNELIGADRVAGAIGTMPRRPVCRVHEATATTVKAEFVHERYIVRKSYAITSGMLQHKEVKLGDGQWFDIDNGIKESRHGYYDEFCWTKTVVPERFSVPVVRADSRDPWLRFNRPDMAAGGGQAAAPVAPAAPVAWEPTPQQVATAMAGPRSVMPPHIKERMVAMAITLKEQWQCSVCADDHEPSAKILTDCGHYLCEGCQTSWKAQQKEQRKAAWQCPECRCPHAY